MKNIIALLAFLSLAFSSAAEPNYDFGYLTVAVYRNLSENEQRLVIVAAREATVFTLHNADIHWLDQCVAELTNEDIQAAVNTVTDVQGEDVDSSVVATFVQLIGQLCIATSQPQAEQPDQGTRQL